MMKNIRNKKKYQTKCTQFTMRDMIAKQHHWYHLLTQIGAQNPHFIRALPNGI